MKLTLKRLCRIIFALYCVGTCYTAYLLIARNVWEKEESSRSKNFKLPDDDLNWNPWGLELENGHQIKEQKQKVPTLQLNDHIKPKKLLFEVDGEKGQKKVPQEHVIEVWGKAAIGHFFWEHVFQAGLDNRLNGIWSYGEKQIKNLIFRFRTGPGVTPAKVPQNTENVVIILNGRESPKINFAQMWLDYLPTLPYLKNVAVVMLGNEECNNDWILPYMHINGGFIKALFIVYDSHLVDDINFFQWPLGVATYRGFPYVRPVTIDPSIQRNFKCNYLGTVYSNSSREELMRVLREEPTAQKCYVKPRFEWLPKETTESLADYMEALRESDLTLNPVGKNSECYRIYEALSFGSVPVIEDLMTPGKCGASKSSSKLNTVSPPLRLLKMHGAPVLYLKNWHELGDVLRLESGRSQEEVVQRRRNVLKWYIRFLEKMQDYFVTVIKRKFFHEIL